MTAKVARLRPVPTIAFEPEEGLRLRRSAGEAGLAKVQGAEDSRPHRPWPHDIYCVQMKAKVAVTLVDDLFSHVKALEDLYEIQIHDHLGLDELTFQIHQIREAAEALQPS